VEEVQPSYRRHFPFVATGLCLCVCVCVAALIFLSTPQRFSMFPFGTNSVIEMRKNTFLSYIYFNLI
jgi:hypothetical protein